MKETGKLGVGGGRGGLAALSLGGNKAISAGSRLGSLSGRRNPECLKPGIFLRRGKAVMTCFAGLRQHAEGQQTFLPGDG